MKNLKSIIASVATLSLTLLLFCSAAPGSSSNAPATIRVVNLKKCVEQSKLGKQEHAAFDALKKQMESVLGEKEKVLNDMATKLEDADYLDSLSPEAETELKRKFRALGQEYTQLQSQYMQTLNQTNMKVIQKITETVSKASATVAQQNHWDFIANEEAGFYSNPSLDVSSQVVATMDQMFDKEASEKPKNKSDVPVTK